MLVCVDPRAGPPQHRLQFSPDLRAAPGDVATRVDQHGILGEACEDGLYVAGLPSGIVRGLDRSDRRFIFR